MPYHWQAYDEDKEAQPWSALTLGARFFILPA
jgi:hypothetical protein